MTLRLGLVGYGMGGRYFHAPFIEAAHGLEIAGVVTRDPVRRAEVRTDLGGVPCYDSMTDLLNAGVDLVTITTPPQTRRELVLEAVQRGVHVVADKPFAPDAAAAQELVDAARRAGVLLDVFHNRRWDTDIRTLRALLDAGDLGTPWRVEARFDLDEAHTLDPGPDGGLLRDLGTHLVDQMMWLLGSVVSVRAQLDHIDLPEGDTVAGFTVDLRHQSGVRSRVAASKTNHAVGKELRVYGSAGSYRWDGSDVQAAAVFGGTRPRDLGDAWGYEDESGWGVLRTAAGPRPVPSARGAYQDFYTAVAEAIVAGTAGPVPGEEGVALLRVLDAAVESDATDQVVHL